MINNNDRKSSASKAEDLLARIKSTQEIVEDTLKTTQEAANQISYVGSVFRKIGDSFSWGNEKVVEPVLGCIPFTKPLWQATLDQYKWFCYPSETFPKAVLRGIQNVFGETSNSSLNIFRKEKKEFKPDIIPLGNFSRSRAGIAALTTVFALSPALNSIPLVGEFIPDIISDHAVATIYEPPYDAARMGLTALFNKGNLHKDTIYLNGKNEIDPKGDIWSVGGCEEKPNCTAEDAVSFRIKPSLMHQAWSLSTGRGPFLSDYVAVAVPNVPSKCEVTSYGMRWRISKWFNSYPILLEAQCSTLSNVLPSAIQPLAPVHQ